MKRSHSDYFVLAPTPFTLIMIFVIVDLDVNNEQTEGIICPIHQLFGLIKGLGMNAFVFQNKKIASGLRKMNWTELLGLAAAACTTTAFLPQVIRAWKTRSTHDISLGMYIIFSTGLVLWFIYGILLPSSAIILANAVTFLLASTVIYMRIKVGI